MEVGNTPDQGAVERDFTTQELLHDLSEDDWANTATPPLGSLSKNLELILISETSNMGMLFLNAGENKKNTSERNLLDTLDEKTWQDFSSEFNQRIKRESKLKDLKEELGVYVDEAWGT